ncbi:MAG: hypothetical protein M0T74_13485 [Desulfitobacterium hafniense]|nr:hypothetical protein [Desulfitobacterium hafniense]
MNELQSISQLFQKKLFRIPDHQRGYAWKQEQFGRFLGRFNELPDRWIDATIPVYYL